MYKLLKLNDTSGRRVIVIASLLVFLLTGMAGCSKDEDKIERIVDGDTVVMGDGRKIRYTGIDTPEKGDPYYEEATEANRRLVEGKKVKLEYDVEEKDRYGRTLAYVYVGQTFVNMELVQKGYAKAYPYPPNTKYREDFSTAQEEAKRKGLGMWVSKQQERGIEILEINPDPPGDDRNNLNGEWVIVRNNSDSSLNMKGFVLSDDSDHIYTFGNVALPAGKEIKIFSGSGKNNPDSLYWGSNIPVWNNNGDTAYLKDSGGSVVDEYSY